MHSGLQTATGRNTETIHIRHKMNLQIIRSGEQFNDHWNYCLVLTQDTIVCRFGLENSKKILGNNNIHK